MKRKTKILNRIAALMITTILVCFIYHEVYSYNPPCNSPATQNDPDKNQKFHGLVIDPALTDELLFSRNNILHFALFEETADSKQKGEPKVMLKHNEYLKPENGSTVNNDTLNYCKQRCFKNLGLIN